MSKENLSNKHRMLLIGAGGLSGLALMSGCDVNPAHELNGDTRKGYAAEIALARANQGIAEFVSSLGPNVDSGIQATLEDAPNNPEGDVPQSRKTVTVQTMSGKVCTVTIVAAKATPEEQAQIGHPGIAVGLASRDTGDFMSTDSLLYPTFSSMEVRVENSTQPARRITENFVDPEVTLEGFSAFTSAGGDETTYPKQVYRYTEGGQPAGTSPLTPQTINETAKLFAQTVNECFANPNDPIVSSAPAESIPPFDPSNPAGNLPAAPPAEGM